MKTLVSRATILGAILAAVLCAPPANAQTRTWVSGTGDDSFPCSRTAPCKTFAAAFAKTAAGGEISVLDAAGYGQLTINKAITINGEGTLASVLVPTGAGITVAAAASDRVILRNISFNGTGGGNHGILVNSGDVTIDKCFIYGFTTGFFGGVGINIANSTHGVLAQTSSGSVTVAVDNARINDLLGIGVGALTANVLMSVQNSYVKNSGTAIFTSGGAGTINVDHSHLTNNTTAVNATGSGSTVRLNDISMYDNQTGLAISNGATIATATNNKSGGNGSSAVPNGNVSSF